MKRCRQCCLLFYKLYAIKLRIKIFHYSNHTFTWLSSLFVLVAVHVAVIVVVQVLVANGDVVAPVVLQNGLV